MSKLAELNTPGLPKVPEDLQEAGRELWRLTLNEWELADSDLVLLHTACQQADRIAECQTIIAADGIMLVDPSGRKRAHPLLAVEKEASNVLMRAWRLLGLKDAEPPKVGRPAMGR